MSKIPPYVSIIFMSSHVRVSYSTKAIRAAIMAAGHEVFKDECSVCNVKIDQGMSDERKVRQLIH